MPLRQHDVRVSAAPSALRLELLEHPVPTGVATRGAPLLFVHGGFHGAWCWSEHFLGHFAAAGHPAYAWSLRGHGASEGGDALARTRLADYVDDLRAAIAALPAPPVLIGHSMGARVIQREVYLQRLGGESGAAVLDTFWRIRHDPARVRSPVLVIAARDDASIPVAVNERLAARYGARCLVVPGSHCVMLDPRWYEAAAAIQGALPALLAPPA